jgi:hypothetical protein
VLSAAKQAEVDTHLMNCEACRSRLAELQWLFVALDNIPEEKPSRDLAATTVAILAVRDTPVRDPATNLSPWRIIVFQLLITVIIAALLWPLLTQSIHRWVQPIQQLATVQFGASWPVLRAPAEQLAQALMAYCQQWSQVGGGTWLQGLPGPPLPDLSTSLWLALVGAICLLWAVATHWLVLAPTSYGTGPNGRANLTTQPPAYRRDGDVP